MNRITKLGFLLCVTIATSAAGPAARAATPDEQFSARLDALEKENSALRARVNRLEAAKAAKLQNRPAVEADPAFASAPRPQNADTAYPVKAAATPISNAPRFEVSASLLYLQPGAGDLEYGTLVTPFPIATPTWANQSLSPKFNPAFRLGVRYMANPFDDIELSWTHQNSTTNGAFAGSPTQMVGPLFLIGPEANDYKNAQGTVKFAYDSVKLDGGHTFCAGCSFQLRAFGGLEFARIGQNLGGSFMAPDGSASMSYNTPSSFTGAGPRLGLRGQYALGDFQLIGEVAGAGLIGTSQARINVSTISPAIVGPNNQFLTSPNSTQVIPSVDARLAAAYAFPASSYGRFKIEVGYQAAVYFDVVSHYSLTSVPTAPMIPPVGIFLSTAQRLPSNFTDQGPYVTGKWLF
jgi:Legionella pneumophila major outer membrane protein precursor